MLWILFNIIIIIIRKPKHKEVGQMPNNMSISNALRSDVLSRWSGSWYLKPAKRHGRTSSPPSTADIVYTLISVWYLCVICQCIKWWIRRRSLATAAVVNYQVHQLFHRRAPFDVIPASRSCSSCRCGAQVYTASLLLYYRLHQYYDFD